MRKAYLLLLVLFVGQSLFPLQLISAQTTETVAPRTGITPGFALLDGTPVRLRLAAAFLPRMQRPVTISILK